MRKVKDRKLLSGLLKKVYCANSLVATLLRAIGIIASVVLAIVFLKDLAWWLDESVLETLAVLYIFCGMGLLPYWLGASSTRQLRERNAKLCCTTSIFPARGRHLIEDASALQIRYTSQRSN